MAQIENQIRYELPILSTSDDLSATPGIFAWQRSHYIISQFIRG
ncbi:hypothetical protein [Nostoc sp. CHAB 5836]|nr:hypothetical protein [Nostoc sp. CHAB 5836]